MTDPNQPYQPFQQSPWPPQPQQQTTVPPVPVSPPPAGTVYTPPPPKKRRAGRLALAIIGGVVGLIVLISVIGALASGGDTPRAASPGTATKPTIAAPTTGAAAPPPAKPADHTPAAREFQIRVKVLSKQCFGSAGCNITFRIDPTYSGPALDPGTTWLITYEVTGVEDGPQVNTFELTGDTASFDSEESASTKTSRAKVTAKVTEITEQ